MNSKTTKRALLGSMTALLLCFSMLIGTTFAWFTDTVTSGSNVIQSGNLDIVLEYWDGTEWVDAEEKVIPFVAADGRTEILWEPGCTYEMAPVRVRNEGSVAAYVLLGIKGITGDEKLLEAITFKTRVENIPESMLTGSQANVYQKFEGAVVDIMYGTPDGNVVFDWPLMGKGVVSPNSGNTDTSAEFTLFGHMDESAGNEYQGLKIEGVSISAVATQQVYEYDSFGREYDANATLPVLPTVITSADAAYDAISGNGNLALGADYKTSDAEKSYSAYRQYAVRDDKNVTIDLNGHTITHDTVYGGMTYLFTVAYNSTLTLEGNGTILSTNGADHANEENCIVYAQSTGAVVINGGNYSPENGLAVWAGNGAHITINGGNFVSTGEKRCELVYSSGGVIDIYGGFFHNAAWEDRPINVADANRGTGFINVYGGTFVNFDPSTGGNDPSNILVADGYKVVSETQANGDVWYTVVAE